MKSRLHWSVLIVAIIGAATGGLFLSDAVAKQRRVSLSANTGVRSLTSDTVRAGTLPAGTPTYVAGNFTFSTPFVLPRPPLSVSVLKDQDVEPEIKVDLFGTVYVTGMHGYPGGVDLWKSTDGGATFAWLGEPDGTQDKCIATNTCIVGAGGGDDSIDVSSGGYLYISSLLPSTVTMSVSYDGGIGGALPGQKWEVNPVSSTIPVNDRQWIAAYGPQTVYMTFDQAPVNTTIWFTKSTDAGKTWSAPSMLIPLETLSRENNVAVDQYNGNIYTTYFPFQKPYELHLLKSTDAGATWTNSIIYSAPTSACLENAWAITAVDRGGNVHVVFTQSTGCTARTNAHVYLISSPDAGATWTSPLRIDSGSGNNSTVMPWIVAGSPGVVDVTWYGSSMSSPDSTPSAPDKSDWWSVYFAQVTNALQASPVISQSLVAPAVHNLPICSQGGNCSGNTRDLSEYYTMTIDPDGNANIAYVDEVNYCAQHPASNCFAHTYYSKQTSGASAYNPPAGPQPSTFSLNIPVGSPGGEPGIKIDSHNCIFTHTPGNPWLWKSVNNGLSFLPPVNPVADNVNAGAGDEDVLPVPKPGGVRPDDLYFADLALDDVNIEKSTDGGATWFEPGPGGAGGIVSVSSDRQWFAFDNVPTAADQTVYLMDHELSTETIRFSAMTNDGGWSPPTSGMTASELILPPSSTFPNTNPGAAFTNKIAHMVYGFFSASSTTTNAMAPPFGKQANLWLAAGAAPTAAGLPPGPFTDTPAFKGVIDSPAQAPSPAPSIPPSAATYGNHIGLLFPSGAIDSAGNIYAVWATNNSRANTLQTGTNNPSTTFDIWMSVSHDGGKNFYGPFRVSNGVGTSLMPGIAAGDAGRVEIVWYQTPNSGPPLVAAAGELQGGPDGVPTGSQWNVMFAQSLNAADREPVFTISQASDHPNHNNGICVNGTLCLLGGDRSLADFFQVAIGPDGLANIAFADNGHSSTHVEFTRQLSGPLALTNPTSPTCIPMIFPVSAVSRKVHGTAGTFDVDLPLSGNPGIECRSGGASGNHQIVVTFAHAVSVGGASVVSGTGSVSNVTTNGSVVTVNLTGVTNAQRIVLDLTNVNDGSNVGDAFVAMAVLNGDANADRFVDSADIAQTKSQSGTTLTSSNFREDLNADGFVDSADIAMVKSRSGTALP